MATFNIEKNPRWSGNCLVVAPDWVPGADNHNYFVCTSSSMVNGPMSIRHFDDYELKQLIEYLSKKIIGKYEANIFKNILFEIHAIVNGGGDIEKLLNLNLESFTANIKMFQQDDIVTKKINYYLPPTKSHKSKQRILYLLISLQHYVCERFDLLNLRIPTVQIRP